METRTVKLKKTVEVENTYYVCHDLNGNELLLPNQACVNSVNYVVNRAKKCESYICKMFELLFVKSKNIEKGDLIEVRLFKPMPHNEYVKNENIFCVGIYDGVSISRFVDDKPVYMILLKDKYCGSSVASHKYPYPWVPLIESESAVEFMVERDGIHNVNDIFKISDKMKEKYDDAKKEKEYYENIN